ELGKVFRTTVTHVPCTAEVEGRQMSGFTPSGWGHRPEVVDGCQHYWHHVRRSQRATDRVHKRIILSGQLTIGRKRIDDLFDAGNNGVSAGLGVAWVPSGGLRTRALMRVKFSNSVSDLTRLHSRA